MKIIPLRKQPGAEVSGIDLSERLSRSEFEKIDHAINHYSVLVFREQSLDDQSQIDFTRLFGDLEEDHVAYYSYGRISYVGHVGNVDATGNKLEHTDRRVKSQTGNEMWHSDSSFREVPSLYSTLYAYEVPDRDGDTEFASARRAYQSLDHETRAGIENLIGIHDYIFSRTKVSEDAVSEGQRTYMRPVRQRLVRKNPLTNEKNIFVGSHLKQIEGWPAEKSRALIEQLNQAVTVPESIYHHQWKVRDFLMWDNRCVLHRGCGYDADRFRRRMHQTRVRGAGPTLAERI